MYFLKRNATTSTQRPDYITTLFTRATNWKQLKSLSTGTHLYRF